MKFYTLLHIARNQTSMHNNKARSFDGQIKAYVRCINLLRKSLRNQGQELVVLTNDQSFLSAFFPGSDIEIREVAFSMNVPSGVAFYSAHFKIEVYKYFSELKEDYMALIDADMICINPMPVSFQNCIDKGIALYYDISNQVHPVYGADKILQDKRVVDKNAQIGMWAGGEFMAGPPQFFADMYRLVEEFLPAYFANINAFHHQGDEFVNSIAIEEMLLNRRSVLLDGGVMSIVGRYWNFPTKHSQPALESFRNCFLLHLPANKRLIARLDANTLPSKNTFSFLKPKLTALAMVNQVKSRIQKLMAAAKK